MMGDGREIVSSKDKIYINFIRRATNPSFRSPDEFNVENDEINQTISIWDRLGQRNVLAKKDWKPLKLEDLSLPLYEPESRIPSFSRAFKEAEKFQNRHKGMLKENKAIEEEMQSNREKQEIIKIQAKKCYEFLISSNNVDVRNNGIICFMNIMFEMDFDISKLPFPSNLVDSKSYSIILK